MAKELYSVFLDDPGQLFERLELVAQAVAEVLEEPLPDARLRVRYSGGVLARDLPEVVARRLTKGLASRQVGSFMLDKRAQLEIPRPQRAGALSFSDEGLELAPFLRRDAPERFEWEDVLACYVHATTERIGGEDREGLPRRGAGRELAPDTRQLLEEIHRFEEDERQRVRLGLDLLLRQGERRVAYRVGAEDGGGLYDSLDATRSADLPEPLDLGFEALAGFVLQGEGQGAWAGLRGSWVEWKGVVTAVRHGEEAWIEVRPQAKAEQAARVILADRRDLMLRNIGEGQKVAYRARLAELEPEHRRIVVDQARFHLLDSAVANFQILTRSLLRRLPEQAFVPAATRVFAAQSSFRAVLFLKREELESFTSWILEAERAGVLAGPEEVGDDDLEDADDAVLVPDRGQTAVDLDDEDLADAEDPADAEEDDEEEVRIVLDDLDDLDDGEDEEDGEDQNGEDEDGEGDEDVDDALDLMTAQSGRLDVEDALAGAELIEGADLDAEGEGEGEGEADDDLAETMKFFDERKSARWEVSDVLEGTDDLDMEDSGEALEEEEVEA